MIRFELIKLLRSRLNRIAMLLGVVLILTVWLSQNFGMDSIYCEASDSYLTGRAALVYARELAAAQGTVLTEEMAADYLRTVQAYEGDLNSDDAYVDVIRKNSALFHYLYNSYADITPTYDYNELKDIDLSEGAGFYARRLEKIRDFLNMDFSFGNYTQEEKSFWLSKAEQVQEPFAWASKAEAARFYDILSLGFYLIAVVIVCISPMFSKEADTGADQLLLSTRFGKTGLVRAKTAASFIFALCYLTACGVFAFLLESLTCGLGWTGLPVQLFGNAIPYSMTMLELCLLVLLTTAIIGITVTSVLLLISAFTKSSIGTMSIALLLLVVPAFLGYSKESGLYNHLLDLSFVRMANLTQIMLRFTDYRIGSVILDQITMCYIVWLLIAAVCLVPLRRVFVSRNIR